MPEIVLRAEELTKRYGATLAVDGLNLEVRRGEVFGLLGPNGAGKTTSIKMICGLLKPDSGRVEIYGRPVLGGSTEVRSRVGMCPQEIVLWERLTCLEQLVFVGRMYGLSGDQARRRSRLLLDELELAARADQQARRLSGGMRRRLNLALALVHQPEILVLDEPEAGLDPQGRVRVRQFLRSIAGRTTLILTTHNMDEAERLGDRVAIIDRGRLLVVDTPEALKARVGEGDVVEIGLAGGLIDESTLPALQAALPAGAAVSVDSGVLVVRLPGAVGALPALLGLLAGRGLPTRDIRLRPNTLEDVFIHLTGRRLRE